MLAALVVSIVSLQSAAISVSDSYDNCFTASDCTAVLYGCSYLPINKAHETDFIMKHRKLMQQDVQCFMRESTIGPPAVTCEQGRCMRQKNAPVRQGGQQPQNATDQSEEIQ